jgi:hypothetical protein
MVEVSVDVAGGLESVKDSVEKRTGDRAQRYA